VAQLGVGGGAAARTADLGDDVVERLVELVDVDDLDPALLRGDKDGGGMQEADAQTELVVVVDLFGELAGRVHDEGHDAAVALEVLLGEGLEVLLGQDGSLVGEDGATVLFGGLGRDLVLDVARGDGGIEAPDMAAEGEVVADERDLVVLDRGVDDGEGAGAGGAFEVFELVDGDLGAGWRLDEGGVLEGVALACGHSLLSCSGQGEEESGSDKEQAGGGRLHRYGTHRDTICILADGRCGRGGAAPQRINFSQPVWDRGTLTRVVFDPTRVCPGSFRRLRMIGAVLCGLTAPAIGQSAGDLPAAPTPSVAAYQSTLPGGITVERATPGALPLSIDDAIATGLKHNLEIESGLQNERRVRGLERTVENNLLPTIQAEAYTRAQEINLAAMGFKVASLGGLLGPGAVANFKTIVKVNTTAAQLNVSQQLFNVPAYFLYKAAKSAVAGSSLTTLNARGNVALAVGTAYLQVIADAAQIENERSLVKVDEVALQQARDLQAAGVGTHLDTLRAQVQLQSEQQTLVSAENQYAKDKIALNRRMGIAADQELTLTDAVPYAELTHAELPELMSLAFQRRKDLLSLESQMEVANQTQKAVKFERLPTIAFGGFYGVLGETTGLYHGVFTAQGSVRFPIFREAEFRGEREVADAQLLGLQQQIASLRVTIEQQIRSSLLDVESANDLVKVAESNVVLSLQELDDAQQRFLAGVSDNLPVVQAEARLAGSQSQVVRTMYQYNAAKLLLARNVGVVESQYRQYLGR